ncbi:MAG TPA: hypothetical protein PLL20_21885 [Phycisphaerae bacterium]|nr:hypothetical protein [Phycisphaerae bacterium]HRR86600.1 hypothetical protein [Phycisphaerae bacterium]
MGAPGKSVVVEGGKRGVLLGGKSAVYNAEEICPACCIEFTQQWSFTDSGFIDGGQDGAFRAYDNPADVPASPWSILNNGLGLRLDWEDDQNCRSHNPYTQYATATCQITVPKAMIMTVNWSGMGETQDPNYELMSLYVNGGLVGSAHAPGGGQGCAGMGPVISNPPPPQQVLLNPGPHTLFIDATTNDPLYHFGAWYRFDLTFELAP